MHDHPVGAPDFNPPAYRFWQPRQIGERQRALKTWIAPFLETHPAMFHVLQSVRKSAMTQSDALYSNGTAVYEEENRVSL